MNKLEADNIELSYGAKSILRGIYLKAEKGEITGILGSNGSGKTSLLNIIFGQLKPNNKFIRIDSLPILKPLYSQVKIHYLPQFSIIPNSMSIEKGFYHYNVSLDEFLTDFPNYSSIDNIELTKFRNLSSGEKRVIEIYLTLKSNADIILLDEPFSYVAPLYVEKIKHLLLSVKKDKIVISNPSYKNEIENFLHSNLNFKPQIIVL